MSYCGLELIRYLSFFECAREEDLKDKLLGFEECGGGLGEGQSVVVCEYWTVW